MGDTETESHPIDCEEGKKKNENYTEGENGTSALMPQNDGQTSMPQNVGQTSMPQNGGQTSMSQNGDQTSMPQNAGQTSIPENGGQSSMPKNAGQTSTPQNGGQSSTPQNGGQSSMPKNAGQTSMPQNAGQTLIPQTGGQTSMPKNGGQTSTPQNGGQTSMPQNGGQTSMPKNAGQTSMPRNGGQTSGSSENFESQRPVEGKDVKVARGDDRDSSRGDHNTEENENENMDVTSSKGEEDVGLVSSITIEEIQLIRTYADPEAVRSIAEDLNLENPGSATDAEIVSALKLETGKRRRGQRKRIRGLLKKTNAKYAKLLAQQMDSVTFKAEIPRLAMRLLMTDVYPFAEALGCSIHRLKQFQLEYCSAASRKGTNETIRYLYKEAEKPSNSDLQLRTQLPRILRDCGYRQIARSYLFDFEVSTSDLMAVAKRIEPDKLAHLLGLRDHTNAPTSTGNKIEDNMKILIEWRKMMCPPDCNHRTALADIMYNAGYKQVAMEIITGEYRDHAPNREALKELANHTFGWRVDHLCKLLDVKLDETIAESVQIDLVEVLLQWLAKRKGKFRELSDKLHKAGYVEVLANEFMTDNEGVCFPSREVLTKLVRQIFSNEIDRLSKALDVKLEKRDGQGVQNDFLELLVRWVEKRNKDSSQISNNLYEAGFIDLSIEFLTGIKHGAVSTVKS
ncbi:uncharacterized protein [Diadema setosum]|uniref:uncharacterized protein n=1 Tax=Diadema setosum TaxID=31175 RepID=UPI003B3BB3BE